MGLLESSRFKLPLQGRVTLLRQLAAKSLRLAAAAPERKLGFTMERQEQDLWCWSATSVSVATFYGRAGRWTQCSLAARVLDRDCCGAAANGACNTTNNLSAPLREVGAFDRWESGSLDFAKVKAEIDAGRPLGWRIAWAGGGGHFAVIEGYKETEGTWLSVDDPLFGPGDVTVDTLLGGRYASSGRWTDTYFTK